MPNTYAKRPLPSRKVQSKPPCSITVRSSVNWSACFMPASIPLEHLGTRIFFLNEILDGLENVKSSDEDRILRRYLNLIHCTLRTNFYQKGQMANPKTMSRLKSTVDALMISPSRVPMLKCGYIVPAWKLFICGWQGRTWRYSLVRSPGRFSDWKSSASLRHKWSRTRSSFPLAPKGALW